MTKHYALILVGFMLVFNTRLNAGPPETLPAPPLEVSVINGNTNPIPVNVTDTKLPVEITNTTPVQVAVPQPLNVGVVNSPTVKSEQSGEWVVSLASSGQPDFSLRPDLRLPPSGRTVGGPGYEALNEGDESHIFERDTIGPSGDIVNVCATAVNLGLASITLAYEGVNVGGSVQRSLREVPPGKTVTVCTPLQDEHPFIIVCPVGSCFAVWRVDQVMVE
jgi:hypothetical protein